MSREIPSHVVEASKLVGFYFLMNNIEEWELGPCASSQQLEKLRARVAELDRLRSQVASLQKRVDAGVEESTRLAALVPGGSGMHLNAAPQDARDADVEVPSEPPQSFIAYMKKNYDRTEICDGAWHAAGIWRAVRAAILAAKGDSEVKNG